MLNSCKPVKKPVRPPHRGPVSFKPWLGVWIWNEDVSLDLALMKRLGYRWIAVKVFDGGGGYNTPRGIINWRNAARLHGLHFGVWGYTYQPSDAVVAASLVSRYEADFFIADVEKEYESARAPYSRMFASTFRQHHPHMYAAISSFGRVDLHPGIDWRGWRANGFGFMPQAYECDSTELTPSACLRAAERFWKPSEIQPTLGTYRGALGLLSPSQLGQSIHGLKLRGVNLWEASSATGSDLTAVAQSV
jgi:hypothetical protein